MQSGIGKLKRLLEGEDETSFNAEQYMMLYTYVRSCMIAASRHVHPYIYSLFHLCRTIYNMCTQKPPHDYSEQLYNRYRDCFSQYISEKVRTACYNQIHQPALGQTIVTIAAGHASSA